MWRKPQRGGAAYHLETIHQMNEPNESSGKGFGWAVLLFGAVWLSGAAAILVKFRLAIPPRKRRSSWSVRGGHTDLGSRQSRYDPDGLFTPPKVATPLIDVDSAKNPTFIFARRWLAGLTRLPGEPLRHVLSRGG